MLHHRVGLTVIPCWFGDGMRLKSIYTFKGSVHLLSPLEGVSSKNLKSDMRVIADPACLATYSPIFKLVSEFLSFHTLDTMGFTVDILLSPAPPAIVVILRP